VASFSNQAVTNNVTPVALASAAYTGSTLTLTYADTLALSSNSVTNPPAASSYTVTVGGVNDAVTSVAVTAGTVGTSGGTVALTLAAAPQTGQTVVVNYTAPSTNPVTDSNGSPVSNITNQLVG
jgi:hypothetical protein